jgi:hypothetical protein
MKILTICAGGVVRSVCMAWRLKMNGHDAIPASYDWTSDETLAMLSGWADKIMPMETRFSDRIPLKYIHKILDADVGPDIWGNPTDSDLSNKCTLILKRHNLGANSCWT